MSVKKALTAIADEIRNNSDSTGASKKYTLDAMPEGIRGVYQHGFETGWSQGEESGHSQWYESRYEEGYNAGYNAGVGESGYGEGFNEGLQQGQEQGRGEAREDLWNAYWDAAQGNGTRTDYDFAFTNLTPALLPPKYAIRPTRAMNLFATNRFIKGDARQLFGGMALDLSGATHVSYALNWTGFTALGTIDLSSAINYNDVFSYSSSLETIELLVMPTTQAKPLSWFANCKALKHIMIEGKIKNSIDFSSCPLTPESMIGIIRHLEHRSDYIYTVVFSSSCWDALNAAYPEPDNDYETWQDVVADSYGWNW